MDTTQTVTHISLCAGYGGIDLGLRGAIPNLRTVAFSEIEGFACANLVSKMEAGLLDCAPIWTDLKTFPWRAFRDRVDILSGGYPCQPFSAAGKRLGTDDPRHLWPFIADGIRLLRPKLCFFENVEGHISLGLREVIGELESMGYSVSWGIFSAREVGAPHQRKRVFILAHSDRERGQLSDWWRESAEQMPVSNGQERRTWPSRPGQPQHAFEPPRVVGDAGSSESQRSKRQELCGTRQGFADADGRPIRTRQTQPALGGDANGTASGMDYAELSDADSAMREDDASSFNGTMADSICGRGQQAGIKCRYREVDEDQGREEGARNKQAVISHNESNDGGGDYAQLCISCDNRTDELRLLGNGVVPATATLAFQTLLAELLNL